MLGGQHHGVHADGCAVLIVLHGDLGLTVRTEIVHQTLLAHVGQALCHLLGDGDSQRHQLRRLIAGVAEHHALVAGAVVQLALALGLGLVALVHAQRDVAGLLVDVGDDSAGIAVEAILGAVVADVQHHLTGDLGDIHIAVGGDLTHDVDQAGGGAGLAGHAAVGVLLKDRIQHRVGDLVADFIGMPLGNGFRSKQMSCHDNFSFLLGTRSKKSALPNRQSAEAFLPSLIFRFVRRIWHLEKTGCRGFIGPVPSPLLIRYELVPYMIAGFLRLSIGFPKKTETIYFLETFPLFKKMT